MTTRCDQSAGEPDDEHDIQDEIARLLRPRWLHPDCRDVCNALELGTCCKYPDNPLVRVAVDLAGSIEGTLGRFGEGAGVSTGGGCAGTAAELAGLFRSVPGLLAQVHAILPRLNQTATTQLLCPVGSLAGALEAACTYGCPWACHDPGVPDRRAELEPLRSLLAECSAAIRTALGWPSG
jgi:hypothetical protein